MEEENIAIEEQTADAEVLTDENGSVTVNVYSADETPVIVAALDPTPDPAADTMPAILESIFGSYNPRTQTVTMTCSDGSIVTSTEIVPGLAGLDYVWLSGVVTFSIILAGFISIVRVVLKNG